mmetsp:Transcript_50239/g.117719  ORF Transcript_50239/g.117719 Transcript_50239/m.117719 type:complete len:309 (+) Transcript_50239:201-1127(+)
MRRLVPTAIGHRRLRHALRRLVQRVVHVAHAEVGEHRPVVGGVELVDGRVVVQLDVARLRAAAAKEHAVSPRGDTRLLRAVVRVLLLGVELVRWPEAQLALQEAAEGEAPAHLQPELVVAREHAQTLARALLRRRPAGLPRLCLLLGCEELVHDRAVAVHAVVEVAQPEDTVEPRRDGALARTAPPRARGSLGRPEVERLVDARKVEVAPVHRALVRREVAADEAERRAPDHQRDAHAALVAERVGHACRHLRGVHAPHARHELGRGEEREMHRGQPMRADEHVPVAERAGDGRLPARLARVEQRRLD